MKAKTSAKSKAKPAEKLTDKEIVKEKFPKAECVKLKFDNYHICQKSSGKNSKMMPIHSGVAKNESDAWKKAAHQIM
jgi:hypothetical protein